MYEDSMYVRWKEFKPPLMENLQELFHEKHFADVTLVSDDGIQLTAHKVILSACSSVLRNILLNNPHQQPLLYMRGIKKTHLISILRFMYCGETKIHQHSVDEFVTICKDLKVNDIETIVDSNADVDDEEGQQDTTEYVEKESIEDHPGIVQEIDEKIEMCAEKNVSEETIEVDMNMEATEISSYQDLTEKHNLKNSGLRKVHHCNECNYQTTNIGNLKRHKYVKHENPNHQHKCEHCDFKATLYEYLIRHTKTMHKEIVCDYKNSSKHTVKNTHKVENDGVSFSCSECAYTTHWASDISSHKALNHTNKLK